MKIFKQIGIAGLLVLTSVPGYSEIDFTGSWTPLFHEDYPERFPGPELGDYMGIPVNAAGRLRGDSYDADRISMVSQYECRPHGSDYNMRGSANLRISRDLDPVTQAPVAFHTFIGFQSAQRTIWLDGRPHPPEYADHSWAGFSTGVWDGNMLNITTTHLKEYYIRRNGVPRSDQAVVTEHWTRHGNYLTVIVVINDPVFLTEPLVRSENWIYDPGQEILPSNCEPAPEVPNPPGVITPHHLPGTNPFLHEVADWYGIPYDAVRGGAETMRPEYRKVMGKPEHVPEKCERYCDCGKDAGACNLH
jgi:hypothetical protein